MLSSQTESFKPGYSLVEYLLTLKTSNKQVRINCNNQIEIIIANSNKKYLIFQEEE